MHCQVQCLVLQSVYLLSLCKNSPLTMISVWDKPVYELCVVLTCAVQFSSKHDCDLNKAEIVLNLV